jgi:hypothetical protein
LNLILDLRRVACDPAHSNGDGVEDLATAHGTSYNVSLLLGIDDGTFLMPQTYGSDLDFTLSIMAAT